MLAKEQRIGALVLFSIALAAWLFVAVRQSRQIIPSDAPDSGHPKRTWEERKDSMRRADSLRYAQWAAEREQRYDSFRMADSMRRAEWKRIRQQQYDSFRLADSLWRDSVGWRYPKHIKKDTVLDLNRCDTAELQLIRGIGRYTAVQIVRYREQLGGFCRPGQLTDEPLSKLHLDTLLHHFTADTNDIRPLDVNTCSPERLQRHPYLRYNQAKAIYTLRRKRVKIHSIDELRSLPELTEQDLNRLAPYLNFE
jgi:DNA uptake protein ComE-like DNA-binding protein